MIPKRRRAALERLLAAVLVALLVPKARPSDGCVVLCPPGRGNVGDQALVQAAVDNVGGPVVLVLRDERDFEPLEDAGRVRLLALPALLYGRLADSLRDAVRLLRAVRTTRAVCVVGADIMDGAYSEPASVRRMQWASALAGRRDVRVLGFSWNSHPTDLALDALRRADPRLVLLARDPRTAERLRAETAATVVDTADTVFRLRPRDSPSEELTWARALDRPLLVVNLNALIHRKVDQLTPLTEVCRRFLDDGWAVLLLPHGPRIAPSDVQLAQQAAARLDHPSVRVAEGVLSPNQVQAIGGAATMVITGRMHLAVMSLSVGTPVLTISYQGKVEGLYELLGLQEHWLDLEEGFAGRLERSAIALRDTLPAVRQRLTDRIRGVHLLAARNFDGLSVPEPAPLAAVAR